jgi:hypothetical protein
MSFDRWSLRQNTHRAVQHACFAVLNLSVDEIQIARRDE